MHTCPENCTLGREPPTAFSYRSPRYRAREAKLRRRCPTLIPSAAWWEKQIDFDEAGVIISQNVCPVVAGRASPLVLWSATSEIEDSRQMKGEICFLTRVLNDETKDIDEWRWSRNVSLAYTYAISPKRVTFRSGMSLVAIILPRRHINYQ